MVPHKDLATLPVGSQIKLVRDKLDDLSWKLTGQANILKVIKVDVKDTHEEIKELRKEFHMQDQKLDRWKSELFNKIDNGFAKPIKDLQDESAATHLAN